MVCEESATDESTTFISEASRSFGKCIPDPLLFAETVPALQSPNSPTLTRPCGQEGPVTPVQLSVLYGCCTR